MKLASAKVLIWLDALFLWLEQMLLDASEAAGHVAFRLRERGRRLLS